jgi:acyl-CoA thioesterase
MHPFDSGIALTRTDEGTYRGTLDRTWWIDFGPNGGFIASVMLQSIVLTVDDLERAPRSLSVHYPGRAKEGEFDIEVAIERKGRTMTFASARMRQNGRLLTVAQCVLSPDRPGGDFDHAPAPEAPLPDDLAGAAPPSEMLPAFAQNFEYRFALGHLPYSLAEAASIGGWIRPKEPRVVDALLVPTFADGFPPASFSMSDRPFAIPTLDLTIHFRAALPLVEARPGDWSLAHFSSRYARGGFVEEDGYIWAPDGTLLAQSRQLAIYGTETGVAFKTDRS